MDQQTKQALKHDQFIDTTNTSLDWVSENRKQVIAAGSVLLAVILVFVIGLVIYNNQKEKASVAFGAAMQAYQTPVVPAGQQVPPGVKTYPTEADRAKAANQLFQQAADKYSLTPGGKIARYFAGITAMEAGDNAGAESALKQVAGGWNHDLASLGKLSLAQLYRQTGRDAQAIETYNDLAAKPSTAVPAGLAQLQLAELYESQNKPDQARKIYAQIKDKDAKGAAAQIAAQRLNPAAAAMPGLPQ